MNIALWVLQVLLALLFVFHGFTMLKPNEEKLRKQGMVYIVDMNVGLRNLVGVAEGLAGFGLILPAALGIAVWLTPAAATGLAVLMVGAFIYHIPRHEYPNLIFNTVLGILAGVVAWGRFGPYHF